MDDKLRKIISEILAVTEDQIDSTTSTETQPKWDSLRHMNLILAIEDAFSVRFSDDEIPLLTSVTAIEKALAVRR